jgi:hypothetical protein
MLRTRSTSRRWRNILVAMVVLSVGAAVERSTSADQFGSFSFVGTLASRTSTSPFNTTAADRAGGSGELSATAFLSNDDGIAQATAQLSGTLSLPELGVYVRSNAPRRGGRAGARAQQEYRYDGAVSTTALLQVALDGEVLNSTSSGNPLSADVAVILGRDLPVSTSEGTYAGTLLFETIPFSPDLDLLAHAELALTGASIPQSTSANLTFTLNPGDHFIVWAEMFAFAVSGQTVDALNTLTTSLSNVSNVTVVPEPASTALLSSLLLGMIRLRQRSASVPSMA